MQPSSPPSSSPLSAASRSQVWVKGGRQEEESAGGEGGEEKTCLRLSMSTSATQNMASAFDRALRRGEQGDFVSAVFKKEPLAPREGRGGTAAPRVLQAQEGPGRRRHAWLRGRTWQQFVLISFFSFCFPPRRVLPRDAVAVARGPLPVTAESGGRHRAGSAAGRARRSAPSSCSLCQSL